MQKNCKAEALLEKLQISKNCSSSPSPVKQGCHCCNRKLLKAEDQNFVLSPVPRSISEIQSQALCLKKRKYFEAFIEKRLSLAKKRKLFTPEKISSANANENNDNRNWTSHSGFIPKNCYSTNPDSFAASYPQQLTFQQQVCSKNLKAQKFDSPCIVDSFHEVTRPHQKSSLVDSPNVLDKLPNHNCIVSNKRRYCGSIQNCKTLNIEKIPNRVLHFLEDVPVEFINYPPSRIPRLFRRSQSAFCEARDVLEARRPKAHCYQRFNSWTNGGNRSFSHLKDHNFQKELNYRSISYPESSVVHSTELNSNANATPHKSLTNETELDPNSIKRFTNQILPAQSNSNLFEFASAYPSKQSFKDAVEYFEKRSDTVAPHTKGWQDTYSDYRRTCEPFKEQITNSSLPEERDIESLARLKVGSSNTLACSCRHKESLPRNCASQVAACKAKPVSNCQCPSYKSLKEEITLLDQSPVNLSSLVKYPSTQAHSFEERGQYSSISKQIFLEDRNLSLEFSNNQTLRSGRTVSKFSKSLALSNTQKSCETSSVLLAQTASKQLFQSSTNNHNVKEEASYHIVDNQRDINCVSFPLFESSAQSLHNKANSTHYQQQRRLSTTTSTASNSSSEFCYEQKFVDMGCIHSVSQKKRVEPCRNSIYSEVRATIDQSPTIIEEYSPIVLRYRTPYFRAQAQVIMPPIRNKETWTVGWIQACDYMKFINQYGNLGFSSWEIPALKANKVAAVSDSDGVSYPWYGNTTEIATIVGPTDSYTRMKLTMNDNFYPSVTWDIPVSEGTNAHLTEIVRDQSFITWLAAINETTKEIIILKTVRWSFYLEIHIDPTRDLGHRARVVTPPIQNQPSITNGPCEQHSFGAASKIRRRTTANNSNSNCLNSIPMSALVRPSANNAQTLIWRPTSNEPVIVVPAKEEHRETNELVLFNGCSAMHGKEAIMKEISKQELIQMQQLTR